jgi:hypothetical protein
MTIRNLGIILLLLLCLTALWATFARYQQLVSLRSEQQRLIAQSEQANQFLPPAPEGAEFAGNPSEGASVSAELLRLRGEVGVLMRRRRELDAVQKENQSLRLQLASAPTNNLSARRLPPGYIRKAQAQMAGYNAPEDTLQTFLWALAHRNYQGLLEAFSPQAAQQFASNIPAAQSSNFFHEVETVLPGLGIVGRKDLADGAVELTVELIPGMDKPLRFERINGQWKLASPNL